MAQLFSSLYFRKVFVTLSVFVSRGMTQVRWCEALWGSEAAGRGSTCALVALAQVPVEMVRFHFAYCLR